jgi:hypothetical protein
VSRQTLIAIARKDAGGHRGSTTGCHEKRSSAQYFKQVDLLGQTLSQQVLAPAVNKGKSRITLLIRNPLALDHIDNC